MGRHPITRIIIHRHGMGTIFLKLACKVGRQWRLGTKVWVGGSGGPVNGAGVCVGRQFTGGMQEGKQGRLQGGVCVGKLAGKVCRTCLSRSSLHRHGKNHSNGNVVATRG